MSDFVHHFLIHLPFFLFLFFALFIYLLALPTSIFIFLVHSIITMLHLRDTDGIELSDVTLMTINRW
jgi:hypothetical protein